MENIGSEETVVLAFGQANENLVGGIEFMSAGMDVPTAQCRGAFPHRFRTLPVVGGLLAALGLYVLTLNDSFNSSYRRIALRRTQ